MRSNPSPCAPARQVGASGPSAPQQPSHDWLTPATRRVLAGEPTTRRGIILAAQELMWVSDQGCAAIDAEFLVVLLMASARASGVGCDDIEGDELTAICRSVKEVIRPDGESCPECSAPQGANSKIHTFNPGKILPELAHLLIDPKSPGTKQGHQVAELDAIEAAAWGDD